MSRRPAALRQKFVATRFGEGGRLTAIMKRLHRYLTVTSGILCVLTAIIFFASYLLKLSRDKDNGGFMLGKGVFFVKGNLCCSPCWFQSLKDFTSKEGRFVYLNGYVEHRRVFLPLGNYGVARLKENWRGAADNRLINTVNWDCDLPGLHYHSYFDSDDFLPLNPADSFQSGWCFFRVSLWYPICIFSILPGLQIYRRLRSARNHAPIK